MYKNNILMIDLTCTDKGNFSYLLKATVPENEKGIICKVTSVLFAYDWNIEEAVAETIEGNLIKELFIIRNIHETKMTEKSFKLIRADLACLMRDEFSTSEYLEKAGKQILPQKEDVPSVVNVFNPPTIDSSVLDIRTWDRPGLLHEISKVLFLSNIDIISFTVKTDDKKIRDSFLICTPDRERLTEESCQLLKENLLKVL